MIHRPEYVKKLLQKYLEGTASQTELARWAAARHIYTDDEIASMAAEILQQTKRTVTSREIDQYLAEPDEALTQIPAEVGHPLDWRQHIRTVAALAAITIAIFILMATYLFFSKQRESIPGIVCNGLTREENISTSIFSCDLYFKKDSSVTIGSSTTGEIGRLGDIAIVQTQSGLLEFHVNAESGKTAVDPGVFIAVTTGPQQQYLLRLPDGTRVRLNASSSVRLPVAQWNNHAEKEIEINGEAYIEKAHSEQKLTIRTENASVIVNNNATLNIQGVPQFTSAALMKGTCVLSNRAGKSIRMKRSGSKGFFIEFNTSKNAYSDTLALLPVYDMNRELMWTKTERVYNHISTRLFAEEMSRWYGFTIKNLNCIPENKYISTKICYRATLQEVLAVFRNAGLSVYESKGMISFCDPAPGKGKALADHKQKAN